MATQQQIASMLAAQNVKKPYTEFYAFVSKRVAVAQGASAVTDTIQLQADADFIIEKLCYMADIAGAAQTDSSRVVPNITVLLTSTSSGKGLMNIAMPVSSLFGTAFTPFILPKPYYLTGNSTIQIQYNSNEAVNAVNMQLAFIGRKVFRYDNTGTIPAQ